VLGEDRLEVKLHALDRHAVADARILLRRARISKQSGNVSASTISDW
jgi:hypothetical protein